MMARVSSGHRALEAFSLLLSPCTLPCPHTPLTRSPSAHLGSVLRAPGSVSAHPAPSAHPSGLRAPRSVRAPGPVRAPAPGPRIRSAPRTPAPGPRTRLRPRTRPPAHPAPSEDPAPSRAHSGGSVPRTRLRPRTRAPPSSASWGTSDGLSQLSHAALQTVMVVPVSVLCKPQSSIHVPAIIMNFFS